MDISIVIINFRTPELTKACVCSVGNVFKNSIYTYEIILVDNYSNDGHFVELQNLESDTIHVYQTPKNGGFGYGNNFGVAHSCGEYVFFLNSDTVLYPTIIEEMLSYMKSHNKCGALTCYMEDGEKAPLVVTHSFENTKTLFLQTIIKPLVPKFLQRKRAELYQTKKMEEVIPCDWVSGAAMLMPRNVFEQVGGWNELFFMYMEDEELCFRLHKAGYDVGLYPKMGLQHLIGKSGGSAFVAYEQYRSKILYYRLVNKKDKWIIKKLLFNQARQYMKHLSKKERKDVIKRLKEV